MAKDLGKRSTSNAIAAVAASRCRLLIAAPTARIAMAASCHYAKNPLSVSAAVGASFHRKALTCLDRCAPSFRYVSWPQNAPFPTCSNNVSVNSGPLGFATTKRTFLVRGRQSILLRKKMGVRVISAFTRVFNALLPAHDHLTTHAAFLKRREFITLIGGAAVAWPLVARAQQLSKLPRVGFLQRIQNENVVAFIQALRDAGYRSLQFISTTTGARMEL
jgi:hypothetical protein